MPLSASARTTGRASFDSFSVNSLKKLSLTSSTPGTCASRSAAATAPAWLSRGERAQPRLAQQGHVDREGQRAEPRVGADVRRRLLAADMLLARRQRQHEAALAFGIDRLAAEAPRHLADILLLAAEQPDIRPAELQPDADRLAFADDDVGVHLARRLERAQRDRLGHHRDQQRLLRVARVGQRAQVGDAAEDVGILDDDADVSSSIAAIRRVDVGFGGQASAATCRAGRR